MGFIKGPGTAGYVPIWTGARTLGDSPITVSGNQTTLNGRAYVVIGNSSTNKFVVMYDGGIFYPYDDNGTKLGQDIRRWSDIWAVTTHFGDLGFSEKVCAVCRKRFKVGDSVILMVKLVNESGIRTVPKHEAC